MSLNGRRIGSIDTKKMVYLALMSACVVVVECISSFVIPLFMLALNFALIPITIGVALCGKFSGAWLGFLSSFIILFAPNTAGFMSFNAPATIFIVILKGTIAGFVGGLLYHLIAKRNRLVASIVSSFVVPTINTGIFVLGAFIFFQDYEYFVTTDVGNFFMVLVGVGVFFNYALEVLINLVLSPAVVHIINIKKKA